ncbi:conserved hypothetical protein [Rubrivivax sp. A210]|nr:conserved hypothetical protein [Rubrivivax sp. A210]
MARLSVPVGVSDQATRMFLLTRVVAALIESENSALADHLRAGLPPEIVDRLRSLPLSEALHFTGGDCGIFIAIDGPALHRQLARLDRLQADRRQYEYFVRGGASPQLISRLFSVSHSDVRRLRKLIAPATSSGGRPKVPQDSLRDLILTTWRELGVQQSERDRYYLLSMAFPALPIVCLESVVEDVPPASADEQGRPGRH